MSQIQIRGLSFAYDSPYKIVFQNLDLCLDTSWRLGVIGRNGKGKTTLLNLLRGCLLPDKGTIEMPLSPVYFPNTEFLQQKANPTVHFAIRESVAPFAKWEEMMESLLQSGDSESLQKYGEILDLYNENEGYEIDAKIERELPKLGFDSSILTRSFQTLSGGEKTRVMLLSLFLKKNAYCLIDEPTNHLDIEGREIVGKYLSKQSGFMLVSHDRHLLDICADHILCLGRSEITVQKGNYSVWKENFDRLEENERRRNENLEREIKSLEETARKRRNWSASAENEKHKKSDTEGMLDKGYIGAVSARIMKRALVQERRIDEKLTEKKSLLRNTEKKRRLKLDSSQKLPDILLQIDHIQIRYGDKIIIRDFSLALRKGERIALVGGNGSGKTSIFKAIAKEIPLASGSIYHPPYLQISRARQIPLWTTGNLSDHIHDSGIDETHFRNIMGVMGVSGEIFDKGLETFSEGERKKIEICRSFLSENSLLLWDEPLNYLDMNAREQLEEVILQDLPTMLFIEHDRAFIDRIATDVVRLE